MFRDSPKVMAAAAFVAGGVLFGGVALGTAGARGAVTTTTTVPGKGLSDDQYAATNAFEQSVQMPADTNEDATLAIPAGKRLTITALLNGGENAANWACFLSTTLNATSTVVDVQADETPAFAPLPVDSGSIACNAEGDSSGDVTVVGYLTRLPAT